MLVQVSFCIFLFVYAVIKINIFFRFFSYLKIESNRTLIKKNKLIIALSILMLFLNLAISIIFFKIV